MSALEFDERTSRRVESTYLTADVVRQRQVVRGTLALRPGERVLDLGSGPGFLAVEMAGEVGADGVVCGIDPAASMLAMAERRSGGAVEFRQAGADRIPYPDGGFDAVVSTQVFEYLEDVPGALAEVRRVLRPGGRLLVMDTDWDSIVWRSPDDALTERVLRAFEQHLADPRLPRKLPAALTAAGFRDVRTSVLPVLNVGYAPDTFSEGLLALVATFVVGRDGITAAEAEAWADGQRALGSDYFFSLNRYLFLATG
ncbi:methyltransferase domain-containing protein [Umezawaea endophytica]|uniref:Methyltransferase domain-containing protein n=1 Tax=Umezawaea endophytica TaxID=1654476 RepID=A0A9X2VKJ6_9PSEU|nr:methyltransferase domain-containing protein [Umezawaea endophytica]MCS7478099.1 methyltransferase domain-containing protein [Umezawaea endophytica]